MAQPRHWMVPCTGVVLTALLAGGGIESFATAAHGRSVVQVGRYSTYAATPSAAQRYPLAEVVNIILGRTIATVGDALGEVLHGSGYAFVHGADPHARTLLSKPLPGVHRQLGPMARATALQVLVGQPYQVLVSDVRREVCIALRPGVAPEQLTAIDSPVTTDDRSDRAEAAAPALPHTASGPLRRSVDTTVPARPLLAGGGYARK